MSLTELRLNRRHSASPVTRAALPPTKTHTLQALHTYMAVQRPLIRARPAPPLCGNSPRVRVHGTIRHLNSSAAGTCGMMEKGKWDAMCHCIFVTRFFKVPQRVSASDPLLLRSVRRIQDIRWRNAKKRNLNRRPFNHLLLISAQLHTETLITAPNHRTK